MNRRFNIDPKRIPEWWTARFHAHQKRIRTVLRMILSTVPGGHAAADLRAAVLRYVPEASGPEIDYAIASMKLDVIIREDDGVIFRLRGEGQS